MITKKQREDIDFINNMINKLLKERAVICKNDTDLSNKVHKIRRERERLHKTLLKVDEKLNKLKEIKNKF